MIVPLRLPPSFRRLVPVLVVGFILLVGAVLRFRHLDWARGYYFQPDESVHMIDYLLRLPASLNPYEAGPYTYGGLPLYLYRFSAQSLARITHDSVWIDKWHVTLIARAYAAAASTATIVLLYALWVRLGAANVGWISALALAVSPLSIQYAHYGVVDTLLTFWVVLASLLGVRAWQTGRLLDWGVAGLAIGLATATKTSGLIWVLLLLIAAYGNWSRTRSCRRSLSVLVVGSIGVLVGVLLTSPYYLLDWSAFYQIMAMQSAKTVTGRILATYHWQFLKVMPFQFELKQLSLWAVGLPLAILGLTGIGILWKQMLWPRAQIEWLLVLAPPTAFFLMIGLWHSKFIRYLLPLIPYVAFGVAQPMRMTLKSRLKFMRWGVSVATVAALLYSGLLGIAISNVYAGPDPRIAASEWVLKNIPAGTRILHDPEPLITIPLRHTKRFQIQILDLYGNRMRNINNLDFYVQALHDQQFIVIVSRRNYGAIYHLSALFPQAACYYRSVFNGELGYRLRTQFSDYPHLGPFVWNTDQAEETFKVFDHPHVYIFERVQALNREQMRTVLDECGQ